MVVSDGIRFTRQSLEKKYPKLDPKLELSMARTSGYRCQGPFLGAGDAPCRLQESGRSPDAKGHRTRQVIA